MRIVPLSLQFLMFLGLQIALSLGLVFYLNTLANSNYQTFHRASTNFVEASKTIESLRKSFATTSAKIEQVTSELTPGNRVDVRNQVLALQQLASALRTDTALDGLRQIAGSQVRALSQSIDNQAKELITAAAATASASPTEVKRIQTRLRDERNRIMIDEFGALISAANQNLEDTMALLQGSTESMSTQYQTLLILFIVLQIALMMTAFWYINHQIKQLADVTDRLIDGEATAALPQQKRNDQIGRLARAVQHFRTSLITLSNSREQLKAILKKHDQETLSRRKAEKQLALTASVFENVQEAVLLTDISGYVTRANPAALDLLHSTEKQLSTKPLLEFLLKQDTQVVEPLWRQVLEQGYWSGEIEFTPDKQPSIYALISIKRIGEAREGKGHVIFVLNDHTEIKTRETQMRFLAEQDPITGLYNRHFFIKQGEKRIEAKPQEPFSIILLGIDNFRAINDALGHHEGDQILVEMGRKLKEMLPSNSVLARVGGDEFAFYLTPKNRHNIEEETRELAERALATIRKPLQINNYQIILKISGGTSIYPDDGDTIEELIKTNDLAVSMAKAEGGDRLYMHGAKMQNLARRRFMLQQALDKALGKRELRLSYQPQVSLANGQITGFEILMRWRHAGDWISPSEFIPLAEETDTIARITEWAFTEACSRIYEWERQTEETFNLSLNLPPRLLLIDKIDERLVHIAKQAGLPLSSITLEITESSFGTDPALMSDQLHRLAMQGFTIAIDDFGTGYSSLSYLSTLPISKIKIDKKFVDSICQSAESRKLIKSIIAMAESLELDIVIEGVETVEQLIELKKFDSKMDIQGFVFEPGQSEDFWEGLLMEGQTPVYEIPDLRSPNTKKRTDDRNALGLS